MSRPAPHQSPFNAMTFANIPRPLRKDVDDDARRLIEEAVASGRVRQMPTRFAEGSVESRLKIGV